ncbi:MAG: tetratricopeptide repeat protein [Planctomycetota bacterium]
MNATIRHPSPLVLQTTPQPRCPAALIMGCSLLALSLLPAVTVAQDSPLPFVNGLRDRGYFDTALEYLDKQATNPKLAPEIREVLDFERGQTLQQAGAASRVPDDRTKFFADSEVVLQKFIAEHPQHPLAARANSLLGELLFDRSESLIWAAAEKSAAEERAPLQNEARVLVDRAKAIFQTAHDQYKSQYDAFPKFVDENKDEDTFLKRRDAENKYLRAWLNLVRCTYQRGQTFDRGSEERKQTLIQASEFYEAIHTARRTNTNGLYARLMQGKCFQEQDDIGRALGIYNEILGHPSDADYMKTLKATAQHFRLICLNDPQRNDYRRVILEATAWLQGNRAQSTTASGLGILWEQAIAEEKLSASRELPEKEQKDLQQFALNHAEQVAKYPGAFREPALSMARRLKATLGEKDREPRDFATAFERARGMIAQIQQLTDEINRAADDTERSAKKSALDNHLAEVGRLLKLALALREGDSDPKAVAQTRYLLSFVLLRQGYPLDSIVLARHAMVHDQKSDPDSALNATEIAMAAAVTAWNQAPGSDRDFETRLLRDVCQQILTLYPQSAKGGEARMRLGSVYRTMQQPLEAARWFLEVPESDPQHISARLSAGQSYWAEWTRRSALAEADPTGNPVSAEDLQKWKTEARNLLTQGIQLSRAKTGDMVLPSDDVVAAEVSLASILNLDGEFAAAIERLTKGAEYSVVSAVGAPEGGQRPEEGVRSPSFAGLTFRLLLRAYVGTQQIDQAIATMGELEKVGGEDILSAYTQLGMELQEELKRLTAANATERLTQVRTSFEQFLQKVYESRNKTDYNSLLWIGETYYGLGQGVEGDLTGAEGYFEKAGNAYQEILDQSLASPESRNAILLRLARCRRRQGKFADALKLSEDILAQNAMNLDAQFEAASILADWGEKSEPQRLTESIQGIRSADGKPGTVWGWSALAKRLQQIIQKDPASEFRPRFFDARYELGQARLRIAKTTQDKKAGTAQLGAGMAEINSLVQVFRDLDDVTFARFDRLFQDMQAEAGQAASPLSRNSTEPLADAAAPTDAPADAPTAVAAAPGTPQTTPAPAAEQSSSMLGIIIVVIVGVGIGAVTFIMIRKPKTRVRIPGEAKPSKISLDVPAATGFSFPSDVPVAVPATADFSAFAGVEAPSKRPPGPRPAARPATPAATTSAAPATAPPKPRPRPTDASAAPGAPSGTPRTSPPGTAPPRPRPPQSSNSDSATGEPRPATRPPGPPPIKKTPPPEQPG